MKKSINIILIAVLAISGLIFFSPYLVLMLDSWSGILGQDRGEIRSEVNQYLSQTYGETFVIEDMHYEDVHKRFDLKVYPESNDTLIFNVSAYDREEFIEVRDDYRVVKDLIPVVEKSFPSDSYFSQVSYESPSIQITFFNNNSEALWANLIADYPENIIPTIRIITLGNPIRFIQKENQQINKLVDELKKFGFQNAYIMIKRFSFSDKTLNGISNEINKLGYEVFESRYQENLEEVCTISDIGN